MKINKITLIGGDYDGLTMEDSGATMIRVGVASEWENNRPKLGNFSKVNTSFLKTSTGS